MILLGLDPSLTNTGYCVLDTSRKIPDQVLEFGVIQSSESSLDFLRYEFIADSVRKLIKKYNIKRAGSESPIFGSQQSENLFALYSFIKKVFHQAKVDVVYFSPAQLKMLAKDDPENTTKMGKTEMVDKMLERLNLKKASLFGQRITGDIADAYHVCANASCFWQYYDGILPESKLSPAQYKAFAYQHIFKQGIRKGLIDPKVRGIIHKENELFFCFSKRGKFKKQGKHKAFTKK